MRGWSATTRPSSSCPTSWRASTSKDDRIFTLQLRKGHKWSDGQPFTTEDFRYFWEDVANNKELSPIGPPRELLVDGEPPKVEDPRRADRPLQLVEAEPDFLPALAGAGAALSSSARRTT